jgi:cobalt/nickel transport system permease protein
MVCATFSQGDSMIHRLDPRGRVLVAVAFSILIALTGRLEVLTGGLAAAVATALLARLPLLPALRRLAALNAFMLLLWAVLPLTTPGLTVLSVGTLAFSRQGMAMAAAITLKANAIVLALTALLSTLHLTTLGHALWHLRVPEKLIHLFMFTVRYIDVLHHEYQRQRLAVRVRCFRPRADRHTFRTFGYMVGMLLVRSLDRSERILAAMKCRGFCGQFHVLHHFSFTGRDAVFGAASLFVLITLGWAACT